MADNKQRPSMDGQRQDKQNKMQPEKNPSDSNWQQKEDKNYQR